jgi:TatD DNase family protein
MKTDAHVHFDALLQADPAFIDRYRGGAYLAVSSVHDMEGLKTVASLLAGGADFKISFGIHPQYIVDGLFETLCDLIDGRLDAAFPAAPALSRALVAIGECGFDFYGDKPDRMRNEENESRQRKAFELQLDLAIEKQIPLIIHARKAIECIFEYSSLLRRLPAVIFHSWSGPKNEAESLLHRGVKAYFSFGASIINGNKKAIESCRALPPGSILLETDAPWQPPKGFKFCSIEHIDMILGACANLRGCDALQFEGVIEGNFRRAYGV